ncbi:MAG: hypothetical protein ACJA2G_000058, partial [Cognaticolwellia sp.]
TGKIINKPSIRKPNTDANDMAAFFSILFKPDALMKVLTLNL